MALTAMAPSERSEHLIYAIFPVSLTFYLVLRLDLAYDPRIWVASVTIIAPLFILILYELGLDEFLVKEVARYRLLRQESKESLKKTMKKHRQIVEYRTDCIKDDELRAVIGNALSSYPVRKRLWRIRASFYLMLSVPLLANLPFISFTTMVANDAGTLEPNFSPLIKPELIREISLYLFLVYIAFFAASIIAIGRAYDFEEYEGLRTPTRLAALGFGMALAMEIWSYLGNLTNHWPVEIAMLLALLILAANKYRHRALLNHIEKATAFLDLFDLLAADYAKNPDQYTPPERINGVIRTPTAYPPRASGRLGLVEVGWKLPVKNHLEYLDRVLVRGDWAVFTQSWQRIQSALPKDE